MLQIFCRILHLLIVANQKLFATMSRHARYTDIFIAMSGVMKLLNDRRHIANMMIYRMSIFLQRSKTSLLIQSCGRNLYGTFNMIIEW